jgi:hypothetical protein
VLWGQKTQNAFIKAYGSSAAGKTEMAVRKLAGKLDMGDSEIRHQLEQSDSQSYGGRGTFERHSLG